MPDIPLLQPTVLRGVVEKFTTPESLPLLARVPKTPFPFPTATWDILHGSRTVARNNVVGSEAHIVPRLGRSQRSSSFAHIREKKVMDPMTAWWIRQPGQLAATNAEAAVLREIKDLYSRADNRLELDLWQSLTGTLTVQDQDPDSGVLQVIGEVDYGFTPSHLPNPTASWATATPAQIVTDIKAWKRLIEIDARVPVIEAWASDTVLDYIFNSFASRGDAGTNFAAAALLSDNMKEQFYSTGALPGFMGLSWKSNKSVYDATGSAYTSTPDDPGAQERFLGENTLILGNFTANRPIELYKGDVADWGAGVNNTNRFFKTFTEEDPSERQYLLAESYLPVITGPDNFVTVLDVTDITP